MKKFALIAGLIVLALSAGLYSQRKSAAASSAGMDQQTKQRKLSQRVSRAWDFGSSTEFQQGPSTSSSVPSDISATIDSKLDILMNEGRYPEAAKALLQSSYEMSQDQGIVNANAELDRFHYLENKVKLHPELLRYSYSLAYELFTVAAREGMDTETYQRALESFHPDQLQKSGVCVPAYTNYHAENVRNLVEQCAKHSGTAAIYDYLMNVYFDGKMYIYESDYEYFKVKFDLKKMSDFTAELDLLLNS